MLGLIMAQVSNASFDTALARSPWYREQINQSIWIPPPAILVLLLTLITGHVRTTAVNTSYNGSTCEYMVHGSGSINVPWVTLRLFGPVFFFFVLSCGVVLVVVEVLASGVDS